MDVLVALERQSIPQNNSSVLDPPAGMLVCLSDKLEVDCAANAAIVHGLRIDPGVDD